VTCLLLLSSLISCKGKEGGGSLPELSGSREETDFYVLMSPERKVDILFMVDNSPSMDPKQRALAAGFPKLLEVLRTHPAGMPDLHVGVVSSDMGAGQGEASGGSCMLLGNQGILWGNDPNADPSLDRNRYATVKNFKNGCGMESGARWISDVQNTDGLGRVTNYKGEMSDVFACLATAVGVGGCGYEHQLQAVRVALNPIVGDGTPNSAINPQNVGFLRQRAFLAVVLVTDEDDCSADPDGRYNGGLFAPRNIWDSASLRCAARGHVCNGRDIPNYDPNTGYTGSEPFVAKFADCAAKEDTNPRDYTKLPLIRVRDLVDSVAHAKDRPDDQILASGIIGWPEGGLADAEYRIDKDDTSMPVEQRKMWDYMPICKRDDVKSDDGNLYKAYGGLRLKAFLDGFKRAEEPNLFSICNPDFSEAMTKIGKSIGRMMGVGCISFPLADTDAELSGIQPECQVEQRGFCDTPGRNGCMSDGYTRTPLTMCRDGQGQSLDPEDPQTGEVPTDARPCWYLKHETGDFGCSQYPGGLMPGVLTADGKALPPGVLLHMQCLTCPDGQPGCQVGR
jgi:hypothetical protein